MEKKVRIVFIGGLTNGKIALGYLSQNRFVEIPLVITYPDNLKLPRMADLSGAGSIARTIKNTDANELTSEIKALAPDFVFVAGWSGLLSKELIEIPALGTIGFHPSQLPHDRGRSVLAWQIEDGYTETALTMFYYNELPDCGDIIAQERIKIEENDYINDVLDKVDVTTYNLMRAYFPLLRKGCAPRKAQNINEGTFRRLRTDRDSLIVWRRNANAIYNKIRAISRPYPGAHIQYGEKLIKVWESERILAPRIQEHFPQSQPGEVLAKLKDNGYWVKCRDGIIQIHVDESLETGVIL